MGRHLFDAEPNPTFHFDADPDQNLGPDPILIFTYGMLGNHNFLKLIHSSASLHCFLFLVIVTGFIKFIILGSTVRTWYFEIFRKNYTEFFIWLK